MIKNIEGIKHIQKILRKKEIIIILCNCQVEYSGRAESFLEFGDRIIIIKQDGTILVHQPEGNNPINYMKPKSHATIRQKQEQIILESVNSSLKEHLTITINKVYNICSERLKDGKKLILEGNEKDMSDYLFKNPQLIEENFNPLSREEHTKYGFIDLLGNDKNGNLIVVECKRYTADFNAVHQLKRYVDRIKKIRGLLKVRGIIVSPEITGNALLLLKEFNLEYKKIIPPKKYEKENKKQKKLEHY